MKKETKIIATVGPGTLEFKAFQAVIAQGADFLRINTAYATKEQYNALLENLKQVGAKNIEIVLDIRNAQALPKWLKYRFDMVAVSFAETAKQLREIQNIVPNKKIISKIETKKGVQNFEEVLENSWGVMVARGDLGEAVTLEKVPCLQKQLAKQTLKENKFLIIATEMLLSMMNKLQPTRAEASDVANAVFEGARAVMLSEETAIGKYPAEAVEYMRKIIEATEDCIKNQKTP